MSHKNFEASQAMDEKPTIQAGSLEATIHTDGKYPIVVLRFEMKMSVVTHISNLFKCIVTCCMDMFYNKRIVRTKFGIYD